MLPARDPSQIYHETKTPVAAKKQSHMTILALPTCIGDVGWSGNGTDLFQIVQVWGKAAVATENLVVNDGSNG